MTFTTQTCIVSEPLELIVEHVKQYLCIYLIFIEFVEQIFLKLNMICLMVKCSVELCGEAIINHWVFSVFDTKKYDAKRLINQLVVYLAKEVLKLFWEKGYIKKPDMAFI